MSRVLKVDSWRVAWGAISAAFGLGKLSHSCESEEGEELLSLACGIAVLSAALAALHSHTEILCSTTTHLITVTKFSWPVKQNQLKTWKYYLFFVFLFFPLTRSSPLCSVCLSFSLLELELNAWNDYEKWYWIILRAKLFVSEWRGWIFLELPVLLVYIKSTLHKIECLHKVQELEKS